MNELPLQRCDYEITPDFLRLTPPHLPSGLILGVTLTAPSITVWQQYSTTDVFKLTVEQYAGIAQIPPDSLQTVKQVHSDRAIVYGGGMLQTPPPEADAVIVNGGEGYGGVFVADCLAVVLFSPKRKICAAVHAGWRGALQRICSKTAAKMCELGAKKDALAAVLACGIGVDSYRVGEELLPLFTEQKHNVDAIFAACDDGWHLDLRQVVARDLIGFGINQQHIYNSGLCSYTERALLWSFRRDGRQSLRNLVYCGWRNSAS